MRNVRRYLYNTAQTNYIPDEREGKHQRHASVSSDNFSSSRSDSWRVQNRCGIPLRMIEPRRRNSWAVTRKPSQDSNLSSSRNDSSATSNSTATWRLSRSSVSSDAASHSGGGKSSFKRISTPATGTSSGLRPGANNKNTMPTSTAAVAAAAAAAAVATGSAAATDIGAITAVNPLLGAAAAVAAAHPTHINSEEDMASLTRSNTIKNQNPVPLILGPPMIPSRSSINTNLQTESRTDKTPTKTTWKKAKKKRVKIKKPPKNESTVLSKPNSSIGQCPEFNNDDEIDDEEASAKIATNRPRLVRQSAFFSEEVVIEPEVCPVHGPLNPGTYDDEDEEDDNVSDVEEDEDGDEEDENEDGEQNENEDEDQEDENEDGDQEGQGNPEESQTGCLASHSLIGGMICEEDEEEDVEDPTSPILKAPGASSHMSGIALVIVPRRLSTVRSRDAVAEHEQQVFIRGSGSNISINNASGGSPLSASPNNMSPNSNVIYATTQQQTTDSTNSPTALLLPAGMAHFGRRKMSEQPVKFYVVPATTGLLTSAKWHSMSHVDGGSVGGSRGGACPLASGSSPSQHGHHPCHHCNSPHSPGGSGHTSPNYAESPASLRSNKAAQLFSQSQSPRLFPKHDGARTPEASIAELAEEMIPFSSSTSSNKDTEDAATSPSQQQLLAERRVSFQLPGINLAGSPTPERISPRSSSSSRRASNT